MLSNFNKLGQPNFFSQHIPEGCLIKSFWSDQLLNPEELNSGPMFGNDLVHASWASSEWGCCLNSVWRNLQHLLFLKISPSPQWQSQTAEWLHLSSCILPVSLLFNFLHPMARSGTFTPIWYLFLAIIMYQYFGRFNRKRKHRAGEINNWLCSFFLSRSKWFTTIAV